MGKSRKVMSVVLSLLIAVQTPAVAGELVADEVLVQEETAAEDVAIEEELLEDVLLEEQIPGVVEEVVPEEEISSGELLENQVEDSVIPEDTFEEELAEELVETITEEVPPGQIDTVPLEGEGIIEEEEPSLVGLASGQCGDNVYWTLNDDGVLTISGTGAMWHWDVYVDIGAVHDNIPWSKFKQKIERVIIESGITSISANSFYDCTSLKNVVIPDSVTSVGIAAFSECTSLTSVTISDSVTSIGNEAFGGCTSLTSVTIPHGVTIIAFGTFRDCSSLSSIMIPDNVTCIDACAFNGCTSLTSVTIPDSVTRIGHSAFSSCTSLTSMTIPDSVTSIAGWIFSDCSSLSSVVIPGSVASIGNSTFSGCTSLTSVTIPDSVTSIGNSVFSDCTSLTSVTIPNSVTSIGDYAFEFCDELDTITFEGDAPHFDGESVFRGVTTTAYYPYKNPTWTADVCQNYDGLIIWIPMRSNGKPCFSDVTNPADFFCDPIYWAVDNGITTGYSDNTFRPRNFCHRAAVVTFLWRLAGEPDEGVSTAFSDMTGNDDFDRAITWASNHGITTGYDDGTFRPYNPCHRAAIVTFIWRYAGKPEPSSAAGFSDMTKNVEFDKAIAWAAENNITTGYNDGTFRPYNSCLRLAVVTFLYRYTHL